MADLTPEQIEQAKQLLAEQESTKADADPIEPPASVEPAPSQELPGTDPPADEGEGQEEGKSSQLAAGVDVSSEASVAILSKVEEMLKTYGDGIEGAFNKLGERIDHLEDCMSPSAAQIKSAQKKRIANAFTYHAPKGDQVDRYTGIRSKAAEFANDINRLCPVSEETENALYHLRSAVMWANAAIACNQADDGTEQG